MIWLLLVTLFTMWSQSADLLCACDLNHIVCLISTPRQTPCLANRSLAVHFLFLLFPHNQLQTQTVTGFVFTDGSLLWADVGSSSPFSAVASPVCPLWAPPAAALSSAHANTYRCVKSKLAQTAEGSVNTARGVCLPKQSW